jgi:glycosyltransferase involved in cell wall biosynthesis
MKVLQVIDFGGWAIGKLAKQIKDNNEHIDIKILEIHPKDYRSAPKMWQDIFDNEVKQFNPDVVHFHYWELANGLAGSDVCKDRKVMLTHHNQKNLLTYGWENIDCLVVHTQKAKQILEEENKWNVEVIQHGIDIEKFKYKEDYKPTDKIGFVGRVCPWKGLLEVGRLAKEVNRKVVMMGRIDKGDYWKECQKYEEQFDIRFGTKDEDQVKVYHEMDCYIGNSRDGIEEGTLCLLEAMACGIPVITTLSGEANDIIKDGENGIVVEFEDYKSLRAGYQRFKDMSIEEVLGS